MTRRPSSRSAAVLGAVLALTLLALFVVRARPLDAQGQGAANEFYDSHFHLTNYIQEGISARQFLEIMGTRVGRSTLFGIPAAAAVVVRELWRLRAHLLPAQRCAALLLLVHRRLHRQRLSVALASRTGALRPDDHRLQSGRHVRRRPHPARAENVSRRLHRHRRVQHPQGIRLGQDLRRDREPHQPRARSHPRLRRRVGPRRDPPQRHRHAVREDRRRAGVPGADQGRSQAPPEDDDHLGARRVWAASSTPCRCRPRRPSARQRRSRWSRRCSTIRRWRT